MATGLLSYADLLTPVYLYTSCDDPVWHEDFLRCFDGSGLTPVQHCGVLGNLQEGRIKAYTSVNSKYVVMLDPDDLVDVDVLKQCVDKLETNPQLGMCGSREQRINADGRPMGYTSMPQLDTRMIYINPAAFHGAVVMRVDMLKGVLPLFKETTYHLFDWALKICMANRYPLCRLPVLGYSYRIHQGGHRMSPRDPKAVPPYNTLASLLNVGAITLTVDDREAIGFNG